MGFRRLGNILADLTSSPDKLRTAAMESAGPLENDDLKQVVIAEEDATKPEDLAEVTGSAGGGCAERTPKGGEIGDVRTPGIGKGKRPTRSRHGWTVQPPRKLTDAEAPANPVVGKRVNEPTRREPRILRAIVNGKCEPTRPTGSPMPGVGSHLRLVWSNDHDGLRGSKMPASRHTKIRTTTIPIAPEAM